MLQSGHKSDPSCNCSGEGNSVELYSCLAATRRLRPVAGVGLRPALWPARPVVRVRPPRVPRDPALPAAHRPDRHDDLRLLHDRDELRAVR